MPIYVFIFALIIIYAILAKTKILGDSKAINALIAIIVAIIFSLFASSTEYIRQITPWFVILILAMFFVLLIIGFSGQKIDAIMKPGFVWVFIAILALIFIIVAISVFPDTFSNFWNNIRDFFIHNTKAAGAVVLLVIAGIVAFVITRK